jgi:dTDP-4-dehydrorhamnose 3,5-epimerase
MEFIPTRLDGPRIVVPRIIEDERGFFLEAFRRSLFTEQGIDFDPVQQNHSRSTRGVVRGMHFQYGEGVAKLVRCVSGAILDVVVDIRPDSPTFGEWEGFELTGDDLRQVFCPVGFGHGFCVLSESADVLYDQSAYYDSDLDSGFAWNDPGVGIAWPADLDLTCSAKDRNAPHLAEIRDSLPFRMA